MITLEPDFELLQIVADAHYGGDADAMIGPLRWLESEIGASRIHRAGRNCLFFAHGNHDVQRYAEAHPDRMHGVIVRDEDTTVKCHKGTGPIVVASYLDDVDLDSDSVVTTSIITNSGLDRTRAVSSIVADCSGYYPLSNVLVEDCNLSFCGLEHVRAMNIDVTRTSLAGTAEEPFVVANTRYANGVEIPHPAQSAGALVFDLGKHAPAQDMFVAI